MYMYVCTYIDYAWYIRLCTWDSNLTHIEVLQGQVNTSWALTPFLNEDWGFERDVKCACRDSRQM